MSENVRGMLVALHKMRKAARELPWDADKEAAAQLADEWSALLDRAAERPHNSNAKSAKGK